MDCSSSALDDKLDCCKWSPTMGEHRLRLRPWLESMLNSNKIKGLEWLDDKKTCFKIPWKHRSKKDWDTDHVQVFMEWAKHTGKHHEGEDPDYVAMKTRLRCAFNKAPDIEEVKDLHSLKSAEPYRVYRFIQKPDIAAWKESSAKQLPSSSRVCAVPPTVCQQTEDDSLSDTDVDSDSDDEEILPSTKPDPDATENCDATAENSVHETTNYNVNLSTTSSSSNNSSNNNTQNYVDTNDAAKLLLSLKSGMDQKTPLVIKPQEPTVTLQSSNAVPVELISRLLSQPKWKLACRMADGQRLEITPPASAIIDHQKSGPESGAKNLSNGACSQNIVVLNRASLNEFICKQQAKTTCSNQGANLPQASADILQQVVQIKTEVVSPDNDDLPHGLATSMTAGVSLATLSVSNGALISAQPRLPVCRVPNIITSSQVHVNGIVTTELPYNDSICNNTRHRKLRRPVLTPMSMKKQSPVVHKVPTRKQRNTSGVTFSNHGNIMATGVKNTIKEIVATKEPVLCEEMLRMREAYGVPVQRAIKAAQVYPEVPNAENGDQNTSNADGGCTETVSSDGKNQVDVDADKNKPRSNADPPGLLPVSQKLSEPSESTPKGACTEMKIEESPCEILDLRVPRTAANRVQEENAQILDLSLKHEVKKPCCLTEEGALDLTLKRKNDNGGLPLSKRPNVKKGASLTMHAIWDLSNPKPKDDDTPRQCSPVAVDLTQLSTASTKVKLENEIKCEDASTKTEFSTNSKASQDGSEVLDASKAVHQVPTLVSERTASEDDYSYDDDELRDEDVNDDDLDINDEDNDTKLAAKQLLELSSRCHRTGKGLPSEELIKAAVNKQVKMEMPEKGASCSGNNWGADLYRRGSPPSSGALSRDSSGTRQRLRPWLESKISSGEIKGLEWVEKEKGIFKIPWKHGGKHDWTPENSRIFMEWAKHTGRYREGIDEEDYATWKTRLRCAFNKAPDIEELKELTDLNCSEPYRVYRLVPKKEMQRFLTPVSSLSRNPEERTNVTSERQQLPIVVEEFCDNTDVHYPSDLRSITSDDLYQVVSHVEVIADDKTFPSDPNTGAPELQVGATSALPLTTIGGNSISVMLTSGSGTQAAASGMLNNPDVTLSMESLMQTEYTNPENPVACPDTANLIKVQLKYQGTVILERELDGKQGCFITSDAQQQNMQQVLVYPPISEPTTRQETQIMSLLPFMKDGVWITCLDGTIYAKRSCKCGVFYVSATALNGEPVKLKRGEDKETIFDYNEQFLPTLDHWQQVGLEPDPSVHLMFGQTCRLNELNENILISLTVTSIKAQEQLASDAQARLQAVSDHFQTVKMEPSDLVTLVDQSTVSLAMTTEGFSQSIHQLSVCGYLPGSGVTCDGSMNNISFHNLLLSEYA